MERAGKKFPVAGVNSGDQPADGWSRDSPFAPDGNWRPGGPRWKTPACSCCATCSRLAIVGIVEFITSPQISRSIACQTILIQRSRRRYLIDYPGFNLKLVAPLAHKLGIRVIYYIVPTFWAWDYDRVYKLKEYCDRIFPVFPFEEELLRKVGINAKYLGSKDLDQIVLTQTRDQIFERFKLDPDKKLVGILPGSRRREVNTLLPIMLEAAERLAAGATTSSSSCPRRHYPPRPDRHLPVAIRRVGESH
jgi:lipid-A-disaccharide synthase